MYETLEAPVIVFGHTHRPGVRRVGRRTMVNSGSVGLPYDGDPRASYALLDEGCPSIRRVPYDVEREIQRLRASGMPGAKWTERMLRTSAPQLP